MLGPANLLSFCFMELIVWGNNRYWFNSMIWMFMKARISLRTNFCSIPGMTVLDERVLSTHSKKAWWHRHTLPSSTEAHAKLVVSSLTNFRNFPTFLSDAASPLRLLALLAWAPPLQDVVLHVEEHKGVNTVAAKTIQSETSVFCAS